MRTERLKSACKASAIHFAITLAVAGVTAFLVFNLWYPDPYNRMAGGRDLYILILKVDVICGPLLTLALFSPNKSRKELTCDLSLVAAIQIAALCYGIWTAWQARPLFLVHEIDRFKLISLVDVDVAAMKKLPADLQPKAFGRPQVIGLRTPSREEQQQVMFESVNGGRDYGERPEFYRKYDKEAALQALQKAGSVDRFLTRYPSQNTAIAKLCAAVGLESKSLRVIPVVARGDWVAVVDSNGEIQGFLEENGFF